MFKWLGVFAMAVLLAPLGATAQSTPTYFTLSSHPDFNKYRPALADSRASLRGGRYWVMSCRERDMELQDKGATIEPGSKQ
ncbi:hypothetical protein [Ralstonia pseudosolanacearum]|uniref:hypothetical protein n=1 Tax=Ralstonia pseudosolanacearum TaxID=1310165 RepID=UPI0039C67D43